MTEEGYAYNMGIAASVAGRCNLRM